MNSIIYIKSKNISIKELKLDDVYKMKQWGYHENPLLIGYNFPKYTEEDIINWYNYKTKPFFNKYFSIYLGETLIGYLGIKRISRILRRSTLGIVLDPDFINKGLGSESLYAFLDYYFNDMKMRRMYLEVDLFNKRALKLYLNLGFVIIDKYLGKFIDDYIDIYGKYYLESKNHFVIKNNKVYNYRYKMVLTKENFNKKVVTKKG